MNSNIHYVHEQCKNDPKFRQRRGERLRFQIQTSPTVFRILSSQAGNLQSFLNDCLSGTQPAIESLVQQRRYQAAPVQSELVWLSWWCTQHISTRPKKVLLTSFHSCWDVSPEDAMHAIWYEWNGPFHQGKILSKVIKIFTERSSPDTGHLPLHRYLALLRSQHLR